MTISYGGDMFYHQSWLPFLLCHRYRVHLLVKKMDKKWTILVMQLRENIYIILYYLFILFIFSAHGVQLDSGEHPLWNYLMPLR